MQGVEFLLFFCSMCTNADHLTCLDLSKICLSVCLSVCLPACHVLNLSVAEQNSVDVAWELLMDTKYQELQHCIYKDQEEFDRFRQIVVNMVMATDIFDKDFKAFRETRWKSAFEGVNPPATEDELHNLRATVMLEHTIQASDVGHAMQHWQ